MCVHYWIIEPPEGATSMGKCKYCKERREFINYACEGFNENVTKHTVGRELNLWMRDDNGHYISTRLMPMSRA